MSFHDKYDNGFDNPSYYYMSSSRIGANTDPRMANQIAEVSKNLNSGMQNVEVLTLQPETFDQIPKEHLTEIKRQAKLADANISLHAPLVEPSGFTQQGWDKSQQLTGQRQIKSIIERAHMLDDKGNIPVVLHGANIFGQEWEKSLPMPEGATDDEKEHPSYIMLGVNQDTGQLQPFKYEERYLLGQKKPEILTPQRRMDSMNQTQWDQEKLAIMSHQKNLDEVRDRMQDAIIQNIHLAERKRTVGLSQSEELAFAKNERNINFMQDHINEISRNVGSAFVDMHTKFKKYVDKDSPEYKAYTESEQGYNQLLDLNKAANEQIRKAEKQFLELRKTVIANPTRENNKRLNEAFGEINNLRNEQTEMIVKDLGGMPTPEVWKPVPKFAIEKASETFADAAFHGFDKFGDKAPVICIENSYPQIPLSRAEDLKQGVLESRKKLAKLLIDKKGMADDEAKEVAEKLIGATWDVGHIYQLRKSGYSREDILKETKKIAGKGIVKHVHITDNFGYGDSHLPPGMGEVPIKEMLKILEKKGGFKGRGTIEAGGWWQHFKSSPHALALEAMGSPMYTYEQGPTWGSSTYAESPMGYGNILPDLHFKDLYGAGFASLPRELGGQVGGERSRFSGTPNQ